MLQSRLLTGFLVLVGLIHLGALGYFLQFQDTEYHRSFPDCLYRTLLIITTVNEPFPEIPDAENPKRFTMVLLVSGMGVVLYTVSAFAAFIIELDVRRGAQKRRLNKMLDQLRDHVIVCGGGETGEVIMRELRRHHTPFLVIEIDPERAAQLTERDPKLVLIEADATQDETLRRAGIERARGVITSLHSDMENLFVVITAHQLNPEAKIVARSVDPATDHKLLRGGADHVVAPNTIGADRMVSAMIRPHIMTFMDRLLRDRSSDNRIDEVEVQPGSKLDGSTLGESQIGERTNSLVLALQPPNETFLCNPHRDQRVTAGTLLVVLSDREGYGTIRRMAGCDERE